MPRQQNLTFEDRLTELGMSPCREAELSGLFLVEEKTGVDSPAIRIALEEAARYDADAVFFTFFPEQEHRSPLPQLYIYNRTNLDFNPTEFGAIHRRLWNAGIVPLAAVIAIGSVRLVNCRQRPEYDTTTGAFICKPFERLEEINEAEFAFLGRSIASGTLWEDPRFKDDFSLDATAHKTLLEHLRHYKKELLREGGLSDGVGKRLLVLAIFLKYLDDRKDARGNGIFPRGFFARFAHADCTDLPGVFRHQGACIELFDHLSDRFNGRVFELSDHERSELSNADLTSLANFLQGDREPSGQQVFWPYYSFDDLPVELISNIYEEFLARESEDSKGVVYTPPILVEFLLEQCLPLEAKSLDMKILDPACGSGIFLVEAFKRLVHCWRLKNNWSTPELNDLKRILRKNLFGVDKADEAVLVTAFSLCVALCEELDPKVIWEKLRFDDLRAENLQGRDFFEIVKDGAFDGRFDLVIGNPPFVSGLSTPAAKEVDRCAATSRGKIPDKQLALLFLEQSFKLCKDNGTVCLIQPAGPLLYNVQARNFRDHLFDNYDIREVLDFTPLESVLFKADVAAAAIVARNRRPEDDEILHVIFRRTRSSKNSLLLETDYYDFHWLGREFVKSNPYAWKTDLLGGGRLHRLVERFADSPTLDGLLEKKERKHGWVRGEGYSIGCGHVPNQHEAPEELEKLSESEVREKFGLKRVPKRASFLTGKTNIPPAAITLNGIESGKLEVLTTIFFERPRQEYKEVFEGPHVMVREVVDDGHIPAILSHDDFVFSKQVYGIHAPPGQEEELQDLAWRLSQSDLYGVLLAATSSRYLVGKATSLLARDVLSLPYPERSELALAWWEQELVDDVRQTWVDFRRRGENSGAMYETDEGDLAAYGETYTRILNLIYENFRTIDPITIGDFVCFFSCYGEEPEIELPAADNAERILQELCHRQQGKRLFVNRIIRLYEKNVIIMIKPNQKRFWLRSVAMRDADETIAELIEAGY